MNWKGSGKKWLLLWWWVVVVVVSDGQNGDHGIGRHGYCGVFFEVAVVVV
jgi:hypothetical protein